MNYRKYDNFENDIQRVNHRPDEKILRWLAENINNEGSFESGKASVYEIRDMLRDQFAISYLLIWPIFEQRHFNGFVTTNKLSIASNTLAGYYNDELRKDIDEIAEYFYYRYSENEYYYHKLEPVNYKHPERNGRFGRIREQNSYNNISHSDRIFLLLFVIYRYRNNIFHGSKGIEEWSQYRKEIQYCLIGMMKISDCMKRHNIVIKD